MANLQRCSYWRVFLGHSGDSKQPLGNVHEFAQPVSADEVGDYLDMGSSEYSCRPSNKRTYLRFIENQKFKKTKVKRCLVTLEDRKLLALLHARDITTQDQFVDFVTKLSNCHYCSPTQPPPSVPDTPVELH